MWNNEELSLPELLAFTFYIVVWWKLITGKVLVTSEHMMVKKIRNFSLTDLLGMEYFMIQIYKFLWTGNISWAINQGELLCKNTSRLSYSQTIPQAAMTNYKSQTRAVCWNAFLQAIKNTMTTYKFSKKNKLTTGSYNYRKKLFKVCDLCTKMMHVYLILQTLLYFPLW